jgi:glutamate synthase domain-containing protein 3
MANLDTQHKSHGMGLHQEQLAGRTQQVFFSPAAEDNFLYPESFDVDLDNKVEFDAGEMEISAINLRIRDLMQAGHGHIVVKNPLAKHSLGVGILNRLKLEFIGSLGYFGCGLIDGPNVRVHGRVGWSFGENMMAGTAVVEKNAGSTFGAAIPAAISSAKAMSGRALVSTRKAELLLLAGARAPFPAL